VPATALKINWENNIVVELIDGKSLAESIIQTIKEKVDKIINLSKRPPCLAVILVGDDPASTVYVAHKRKKCETIGFKSEFFSLPATSSQEKLNNLIKTLNESDQVDGILLQLPLPKELNSDEALDLIDPKKDVDGLTSFNQGLLCQGRSAFEPCTPKGIITMIHSAGISIQGKKACVIGRSRLVGLPMALLLNQHNATVSLVHRHTKNPKDYTQEADILVVAAGVPHLVDDSWLKKGAVVIDVGIHRNKEGKLIGDVNFEKASKKASKISPVPGGVGPMTVASLMENTLKAYEERYF
jgi:methylenetetrahydrofolate dehydrogenase (NADP+)/methenyltetrahydrofolate cyclohydrolase